MNMFERIRDTLDIVSKIAIPAAIFVIGHNFQIASANYEYVKQAIAIATGEHEDRAEIYATYQAYLNNARREPTDTSLLGRTVAAIYDPNTIRDETLDAISLIGQTLIVEAPGGGLLTAGVGDIDQRAAAISAANAQQRTPGLLDLAAAERSDDVVDQRPNVVVYIQYCGTAQAARAEALRAQINAIVFEGARVIAPPTEDVARSFGLSICPTVSDFRYFAPEVADLANSVWAEINTILGTTDLVERQIGGKTAARVSNKTQFEIWFSADAFAR